MLILGIVSHGPGNINAQTLTGPPAVIAPSPLATVPKADQHKHSRALRLHRLSKLELLLPLNYNKPFKTINSPLQAIFVSGRISLAPGHRNYQRTCKPQAVHKPSIPPAIRKLDSSTTSAFLQLQVLCGAIITRRRLLLAQHC